MKLTTTQKRELEKLKGKVTAHQRSIDALVDKAYEITKELDRDGLVVYDYLLNNFPETIDELADKLNDTK